jgi:hypothetical protein
LCSHWAAIFLLREDILGRRRTVGFPPSLARVDFSSDHRTPRDPKHPRQFWVGSWVLYSGARGAGGVQTRIRRVSRVRQGTHYVPDNNGPAAGVEAGGLFRRRGPRRGPGGRGAHPGGPQNRRRRISRWLDPLGFASRVLLRGPN